MLNRYWASPSLNRFVFNFLFLQNKIQSANFKISDFMLVGIQHNQNTFRLTHPFLLHLKIKEIIQIRCVNRYSFALLFVIYF